MDEAGGTGKRQFQIQLVYYYISEDVIVFLIHPRCIIIKIINNKIFQCRRAAIWVGDWLPKCISPVVRALSDNPSGLFSADQIISNADQSSGAAMRWRTVPRAARGNPE